MNKFRQVGRCSRVLLVSPICPPKDFIHRLAYILNALPIVSRPLASLPHHPTSLAVQCICLLRTSGCINLHCCNESQWHSQDVQVPWAQHGHTQCVRNTHLVENLGHTPAVEIYKFYTLKLLFAYKYYSFNLHVHMKLAITHGDL